MDVISLCAIALTGAVISVILKKSNPEYSMIISLCTGVIIIILIISKLEEITAKVNSFLNIVNIDSLYISVLFKSVGI
ncbi:MAG: SpoIIIAC/SpoIIIAD family protein [Clostridia bacterium]|nr:SpoIIIAC/SpoIIIAD family protein [Clostridia bacterium]